LPENRQKETNLKLEEGDDGKFPTFPERKEVGQETC